MYFAKLKGMKKADAEKNIDYWLERLKMTEYKNSLAEKLSKGNQQKIQFIIAVMHNPDLVVLDEPFSGLDPVNTDLLKDVILELVEKGKYIVMSSHQMNSVEEFCDDIVILSRGKTVLKGNLNEIKSVYPKNKLEIDTKEDITKVIDNLKVKEHNRNKYIIQIENEKQAEEILETLVAKKVKVEKYEILKPTLHEIFIEKVGE